MIEALDTVSHPVPQALRRGPRLSRAARGMGSSVLREVMELASRPGVLSFAVGLPAAELFPREALAEATARVLLADPAALQYALPLRELKEQIVGHHGAARGPLPAGAGLPDLGRAAGDGSAGPPPPRSGRPGRSWRRRSTTASGSRCGASSRGSSPCRPARATGIDVDAVEALLAGGARPAFLYLIPESHNPLGVSLPLASRQRLAGWPGRHRVPLIEDDTYGLLGDGPAAPGPARAGRGVDLLHRILLQDPGAGSAGRLDRGSRAADSPALHAQACLRRRHRLPRRIAPSRPSWPRAGCPAIWRGCGTSTAAGGRPCSRLSRPRCLPASGGTVRPAGSTSGSSCRASLDATALLRTAVETEQVAFAPGRGVRRHRGRRHPALPAPELRELSSGADRRGDPAPRPGHLSLRPGRPKRARPPPSRLEAPDGGSDHDISDGRTAAVAALGVAAPDADEVMERLDQPLERLFLLGAQRAAQARGAGGRRARRAPRPLRPPSGAPPPGSAGSSAGR